MRRVASAGVLRRASGPPNDAPSIAAGLHMIQLREKSRLCCNRKQ